MNQELVQLSQSLRLISDHKKRNDEATSYWKNNNRGLLKDKKEQLEKQLNEVNKLIEENEQVETFQQASAIYGKYCRMN